MRVLFVCTGNRARSQMAEGLARALAAPDVEISSAGSHPHAGGVHPLAIEVLRERGIDISGNRPKHVDDLPGAFDYVVTLCDDAARDCPVLPARRARLHWSLPDPAVETGDDAAQKTFFRRIRDEIERHLRDWMAREGLLKKPL